MLRTLKFSRYLADYGWRVSVLTLDRTAYDTVDPSLERQIPDCVQVVRTPYLNTKRHLSIRGRYFAPLATPDAWIGWYLWAVPAGRRLLARDPASVVFSTSPHPTAHLIGRTIAARARLPFVADFRDPWYEIPPEPGTPRIVHALAPLLERAVVRSATHVVTSTAQLRDLLRLRYAQESSSKFTEILNGYDEADFSELPAGERAHEESMLIVHAGSINADFRDPSPLFDAIGRLASRGEVDRSRIRLRFLGGGEFASSERIRRSVESAGLAERVQFLPRIPYEQALAELARADLLLLLQASEDTRSLVPAKLYEYLRSLRPVLALVLPGATTEVLEATGGGWSADPGDSVQLKHAIARAYRLWERGELAQHRADLDSLRRFDRRVLAGRLAQVLEAAVASAATSHT